MVRRLAAVSALVLAGLAMSPAAKAQGFFSFYEPSPRDVVDRLSDQGYTVHLPMVRRGDVYVVDAVGPNRRSTRLIVSTHDGHVLEVYATARRETEERPRVTEDRPRWSRWRDDEADNSSDDYDDSHWRRHTRTAYGDPAPSRLYDRESDFGDKPVPPAPLTDEPPKHHTRKHIPVASPVVAPKPEPSVAAVAPSQPAPPKAEIQSAPKVIEIPQARSVVKPEPKIEPKAETKAEPKIETKTEPKPEVRPAPDKAPAEAKIEDRPAPRVIPLTKPAPAPSPVKAEEAPAPKPPVQAKVESKPIAPAPKPEAPRKKLNDLPVGTLD